MLDLCMSKPTGEVDTSFQDHNHSFVTSAAAAELWNTFCGMRGGVDPGDIGVRPLVVGSCPACETVVTRSSRV